MFIIENALSEAGDRRAKLRLAKQIYSRVHGQYALAPTVPIHRSQEATIDCEQEKAKKREQGRLLRVRAWNLGFVRWVADGTRTRNNQNHNLELYH
jgi:hypothetical protein